MDASRARAGVIGMGRDMTARPGLSLTYPGLSRPVALFSAPAVLSALCTGLAGWVPQISAPAVPARAASGVAGDGQDHVVRSRWLDAPMTGLTATEAESVAKCLRKNMPKIKQGDELVSNGSMRTTRSWFKDECASAK